MGLMGVESWWMAGPALPREAQSQATAHSGARQLAQRWGSAPPLGREAATALFRVLLGSHGGLGGR